MEFWKNDLSYTILSKTFIFYKFDWNLQLLFLILWNNWLEALICLVIQLHV